jgi:CubicO group peptidase (beta-lactamase class C family)
MKALAFLVLLSTGCLSPSFAQTQSVHPDEKMIKSLMQEHHIPALGIGIIREGKVSFSKVYGELEAGVSAPQNAIFNVASLTKPVVTMLTLKLVSMQQWNLDEPLSKYWIDPDVKEDSNAYKLTTRHVLSHQTGFMNWRWLHPTKKLAFDFAPGTKFQYSGEGFEYLKKALEKKFSQSLEKLCDSLIFQPLKMRDSRLTWEDSIEPKFVKWHDKEGKKTYETFKRVSASAADDMLTTVEDYSRFGAAVVNGFGLLPALFNDMVTPKAPIGKNSSMCLGWEYFPGLLNDEYAILHTGSDIGVKTLAILFPKSKGGLVLFTNSDNGYLVYEKLIASLLGEAGTSFLKKAM